MVLLSRCASCSLPLFKNGGRTTECPAPFNKQILLRQFGCNAFCPPLHTNIDGARQTIFGEGVQVNLFKALTFGKNDVSLVVIDGTSEHVKAGELTSEHLGKDITNFLNYRG